MATEEGTDYVLTWKWPVDIVGDDERSKRFGLVFDTGSNIKYVSIRELGLRRAVVMLVKLVEVPCISFK